MTRTVFAMAVAGLLALAVSGTSQAAPIAPLGSVATTESNVTPVYWYRHGWYRHHWYHRHYRHCWRGYYGRLHCAW